MRKVVIVAFVSLDGVMQAPGGPNEDPEGDFDHGGWTVPYWDDAIAAALGEGFWIPFDLLLGRKTYDIFAAHWSRVEMDPAASTCDPATGEIAETFNRVTKYVATHSPETLTWRDSMALGDDVAAAVGRLKENAGPKLLVQGSSALVRRI